MMISCGRPSVPAGVLQTWQKAHAASAAADPASADSKKQGQVGRKGQVEQEQQPRQEFGADLEFHFQRVQPAPDEAQLDEHAARAGDAAGGRCTPPKSPCAVSVALYDSHHMLSSRCFLVAH